MTTQDLTTQDLTTLNNHDLLLGGVAELITENRASAARAVRLLAFFRRHQRDDLARDPDDHFALTARELTEVEVSELWAVPAHLVRRQLNNALWSSTHFPYLWELAQTGAIDSYRAAVIVEAARTSLDSDAAYAALARRLTRYLQRHLRADGLLTCTAKQLRNKLNYEIKVLRSAESEDRFQQAHANRDVTTNDGDAGMSWLTVAGTTDQIQLASHRLTLSARALRAAGDTRTVSQLRADLALELIIRGETGAAVPPYARPIANLTVPIQTVMGLSDHPGVLSGGTVVPAGLARLIAQRPGATWHRMLTDPAGQAVERSTDKYQPTPAIWEQVVGMQTTCFRGACDRASTLSELDHRLRWPEGSTTPSNLWAVCRTDHRVKHAPGFSIEQTKDGAFALRTRAGFLHTVVPTEHPSDQDWVDVPEEIQYAATEITQALARLRTDRERARRLRPDLGWEYNLDCTIRGRAA
ncbi:MAG TPA: HNH endonuclease signature motif containing protein [Marmoricola sp.]|nr:HNH endonuclease signature motif containing protein [Marmoricola sp.]